MQKLWTWDELCTALSIARTRGPNVSGIGIDSRTIESGELFIALPGDPGDRFNVSDRSDRDGHDFVMAARQAGAVAAMVHRQGDFGQPLLEVDDTLDGLWDLGRARRQQLKGHAVALTGSSGKTTLKAFLADALDAFSVVGSLNNHIGVPLSLALTPRDASSVIYEIGTNHPGEIEPLSRLVSPTIAVVLNVLNAHIGNFESIEDLLLEKVSIRHGLTSGGTFVLPCDESFDPFAKEHPTIRFGFSSRADVRGEYLPSDRIRITSGQETVELSVPGGGRHRAETLLAAAAVVCSLQQPLEALRRIRDQVPVGRGNVVSVGRLEVIDDSYNANPDSMRAALEQLRLRAGRTVAILGDMAELGSDAETFHDSLAGSVDKIDLVFCVGPYLRSVYDRLHPSKRGAWHAAATDQLLEDCVAHLRPGDSVLVKGSHGVFWSKDFVNRLVRALQSSP